MANIPGTTSEDNHGKAVDPGAIGYHDPEPSLVHALRPVLDEVQRQIAHIAREQANLTVAPAQQTISLYVDRLLDEMRPTARQQVDRALEPVINSLLDDVDEALAPARATLNSQVDEILHLLLYGYGRPEVSPDATGKPYRAHEMPAAEGAEDSEAKARPARKKKTTRSVSRSAAKEDGAKVARSSTRTSRSTRSAGQSTSRTTGDLREGGTSHDAASDRSRGKGQASKKRSTQRRASPSRKRAAKQES